MSGSDSSVNFRHDLLLLVLYLGNRGLLLLLSCLKIDLSSTGFWQLLLSVKQLLLSHLRLQGVILDCHWLLGEHFQEVQKMKRVLTLSKILFKLKLESNFYKVKPYRVVEGPF